MQTKENNEAITAELKAKEAERHSSMGANLSKNGKYSEAYASFEKAKDIYDQLGDSAKKAEQLRYMGFIKDTMGNSAKAIEHYRESKEIYEGLKEDKEACESAYRLAASLYKEGKESESLEEYRYASKDPDQTSNVFNNLGFLLIEQGAFDEAEENFRKAERSYKEEEENLSLIKNNIGITNYLKGNYAEAEKSFDEAAEIKSLKSDRTIQYILLANNEKESRERYFRYDDVMTRAGILLNAAAAKIALGKKDEACECAAKALELDGGMSYLNLPAAWVYLSAGNKDRAVSLFKNSMEHAKDKEKIEKLILEINPYTFQKVDRNEPCPCGSGKKFKKCHGR